jgi:hypothetical protein
MGKCIKNKKIKIKSLTGLNMLDEDCVLVVTIRVLLLFLVCYLFFGPYLSAGHSFTRLHVHEHLRCLIVYSVYVCTYVYIYMYKYTYILSPN